MRYMMKAGKLTSREEIRAYIKRGPPALEKQICAPDGRVLLETHVRHRNPSECMNGGDVRFREYILLDREGMIRASARPGYAEDDNPEVTGWPINRMPRVDHAAVRIGGNRCRLVMRSVQSYYMERAGGEPALQISHRGLAGGWEIEAEHWIAPEMICGIFIFCRYMEQENEFLIV